MSGMLRVGLSSAAALVLAGCGAPGGDRAQPTAEPDAPVFADLREDMWEATSGAGSVTLDADVAAEDIGAEDLIGDEDPGTQGTLSVTGAPDGTDTEVRFSVGEAAMAQRVADGAEYYGGDEFASMLADQLDPGLSAMVDDAVIERVAGGQWVEFASGGARALVAADDILSALQRDLDGGALDDRPAEEEVREDRRVYVFSADGGEDGTLELVVAADGPPYLLSVEDDGAAYRFSGWDETELPGTPENFITTDDIVAAITEDQGWSGEDSGG